MLFHQKQQKSSASQPFKHVSGSWKPFSDCAYLPKGSNSAINPLEWKHHPDAQRPSRSKRSRGEGRSSDQEHHGEQHETLAKAQRNNETTKETQVWFLVCWPRPKCSWLGQWRCGDRGKNKRSNIEENASRKERGAQASSLGEAWCAYWDSGRQIDLHESARPFWNAT